MTATLQNNVRLRIFLIIVISIVIRIARTHASSSVHKSSGILEANYFLYGFVLLCSLLPFKPGWVAALLVQGIALLLDVLALGLAFIATWRCKDQVGCVQTLPASLIVLAFVGIVTILDSMQTWTIYFILNGPLIITSATQRIRILFSWALPFAYLINITLVVNSTWNVWVTPHLVGDILIIIMANSGEEVLLLVVMVIMVALDAFALLLIDNSLVSKAIFAQIALTVGGILLLLATRKKQLPQEEQMFENSEASVNAEPTILRKRIKSNKLQF